jgi:hypothetical protein
MLGLLAGVAALIPSQALAQSQPEPAVVVSIANLDEQMKDIKYLLSASGFPEFNFFAKAAVTPYTAGVDSTRNSGVMVYFKEGNPGFAVSGFVPVDDLDDLLDVIAGNVGEVEENEDDSFTIITNDGTEVSVKESNGYAFFANEAGLLDEIPSAPEKMLGDLPAKYNLAFKVMPQRLPEPVRKRAMELIKEGSSQTLDQLDEDLQEVQKKNLKMQLEQFEVLLNETETLTIGMCADAENKKLVTDVEMIAKDGSKLAAKFNQAKASEPSRFSGFLMQGAAMNANVQGKMSPEDGKLYAQLISDGKQSMLDELNEEGDFSDAEYDKVEKAVSNIVSVLEATMKKGVVDGGAVLMLEETDANFAAGFTVVDPKKLEETVKDLAPMLKKKAMEEEDVEVNFNFESGTHAGVTFHEVKVSLDDDQEEAREVFGDAVTIIIGVGSDSVYLGTGTAPMPLITKAMDSASEKEFDSEVNFFIAPMLKFASRMKDAPPMVAAMAEKLAENGGDRVRMYSKAIKNGSFSRFEMQDGILSLIKAGYQAAQGELNEDF